MEFPTFQKTKTTGAAMENNLTVLYCLVDDFCKEFVPVWKETMIQSNMKKRGRAG